VIVEQHDEWAVAERRYLSETSMARLRQVTPAVPATTSNASASLAEAVYDRPRPEITSPPRDGRHRARRPTEEVVASIDAHWMRDSGGLRWVVEPICRVPSTYYDAWT
jgi:hypothetical protein